MDVHWAALGPIKEAWILSFKDREGKNNLGTFNSSKLQNLSRLTTIGWGSDIPWDLEDILKDLTPSPHLRVFLGRKESFIAWDASFIRWLGLPLGLEACLQSWLTPAGWKAGPPSVVTWGTKGAYFAISQYGEVKYRAGSGAAWPILTETVDDWDAEDGFSWSDLAVSHSRPVLQQPLTFVC